MNPWQDRCGVVNATVMAINSTSKSTINHCHQPVSNAARVGANAAYQYVLSLGRPRRCMIGTQSGQMVNHDGKKLCNIIIL